MPTSVPPRPALRALAAAALAGGALFVAGCGGDDSTSANTAQQGPGPGGFMADAKVQECLKKAGITMPDRPQGAPPQNGRPPQDGEQPAQRPPGGMRRNSAEQKKVQAALKKCGITMPERPQGAPGYGPPGAPPAAATTTTQDS